MAAPEKRYGLILSTKKAGPIGPTKKPNIFDDGSDDEEPGKPARKKESIGQSILKKQTQLEIDRALAEDPSVYEYDAIYDNLKAKQQERKVAAAVDKTAQKKPKYITGLLKMAEQRKKEHERRVEREVQREREAEGEAFAGKDEFVTSAYRQKLLEMRQAEEKERSEAALEAKLDVMNQKDLSGFYRHLYRQAAEGEEKAAPSSVQPAESEGGATDPDVSKETPRIASGPSCDSASKDNASPTKSGSRDKSSSARGNHSSSDTDSSDRHSGDRHSDRHRNSRHSSGDRPSHRCSLSGDDNEPRRSKQAHDAGHPSDDRSQKHVNRNDDTGRHREMHFSSSNARMDSGPDLSRHARDVMESKLEAEGGEMKHSRRKRSPDQRPMHRQDAGERRSRPGKDADDDGGRREERSQLWRSTARSASAESSEDRDSRTKVSSSKCDRDSERRSEVVQGGSGGGRRSSAAAASSTSGRSQAERQRGRVADGLATEAASPDVAVAQQQQQHATVKRPSDGRDDDDDAGSSEATSALAASSTAGGEPSAPVSASADWSAKYARRHEGDSVDRARARYLARKAANAVVPVVARSKEDD